MAEQTQKLLEIKHLSIQYQTDRGIVQAVDDLELSLAPGETLGVVGETGAGKTTTALGILRLIPDPPGKITQGEILFEGRDLLRLSRNEMRSIRGHQISMIFQDPMTSLDPVIPVGQQIAEMIRLHNPVSRPESLRKAEEMLGTVGIRAERANDYPHQFSGGMKQRVVIAIALACSPALVIADEPTTALDVTVQAQVLALMKQLKEQVHTSIILITHDLGIVSEFCEKTAIMYAGNIVEYGDKKSVFKNRCHPYTQGLFNSIPDLDTDKEELDVIEGFTPDPTNLPTGCPFHPRCPMALPECSQAKPEKKEVRPGHFVRCHRY